VIRRAALGLDKWYDQRDESSMKGVLKNLADARTGVGNFMKLEAMGEVARKLEEMITQLKDMETLISSTLYDKVLHALQNLGPE
jgi:hypothetical protein